MYLYVCTQSLSHVHLFANAMGCSPPGSSVHGVLQASEVPFPSPGDLHGPGLKPTFLTSPPLVGRFFITSAT